MSVRTLRALAPTLRCLWAEQALVYSGEVPLEAAAASPSRPPAPAKNVLVLRRKAASAASPDPPPPSLAPMQRLQPGLAPLTKLTSLTLGAGFDWREFPLLEDGGPTAARRAWRLAARLTLATPVLCQSLKRLAVAPAAAAAVRLHPLCHFSRD